jgi:arylsulfatase A-like enzyme
MPNDQSATRPNVLLVHCHDLGRHLGCYDRGVETPNVDALADDGVLLENQFCTAPQCCPSRGSLMTGRYPHRNGLMGQVTWGWELPETETTLPEHLAAAGYSTHLFGFQHVVQDDERIYGAVHTTNSRARHVADTFAADLDAMTEDGPFFASLAFSEPHLTGDDDPPYSYRFDGVPESAFERYDAADVEPFPYLPDREPIREQRANLNGLVTYTVDEAVGRIRAALDEAGVTEETLLVFTTDHGLAVPRAKGTCYDPGLEVAFVARLPGVLDGGERHDALTSHVDVVPTVLDLLELPAPADLDGESLTPMLTGDAEGPRDSLFAEMTWHERYAPMRAVRTERYKYVRNFWKQQRVHLPADIFGSRAGREMREEFYVTERPREELYDLENDPHEQENLAASRGAFDPADAPSGMFGVPGAGPEPDPEYADVLQRLRTRVREWMEATDDPLLDGPVTRPGTEVWEAGE